MPRINGGGASGGFSFGNGAGFTDVNVPSQGAVIVAVGFLGDTTTVLNVIDDTIGLAWNRINKATPPSLEVWYALNPGPTRTTTVRLSFSASGTAGSFLQTYQLVKAVLPGKIIQSATNQFVPFDYGPLFDPSSIVIAPIHFHGDVSSGQITALEGRLSGVIAGEGPGTPFALAYVDGGAPGQTMTDISFPNAGGYTIISAELLALPPPLIPAPPVNAPTNAPQPAGEVKTDDYGFQESFAPPSEL